MYRVKRRDPGKEISSFLRVPQTAWVTHTGPERMSWSITNMEDYKKSSYFIGVRTRLVGNAIVFSTKANRPVTIASNTPEDAVRSPSMDERLRAVWCLAKQLEAEFAETHTPFPEVVEIFARACQTKGLGACNFLSAATTKKRTVQYI